MPLKPMHMHVLRRQRGAIAIMVGLSLVTLIIALGLVVDLGHMFTAKTELQNAADACALAAVRELDGGADAVKRATAAGKMVAGYNKFDLQGDPIAEASVTVSFPVTQRAHCLIDQQGRRGHWFIQLATLLGGGGSTWSMRAEAEAKLVPGMNLCAIPLAICTTDPTADNRNFTQGEWYGGRPPAGAAENGHYSWLNFPGYSGGKDIKGMLEGDGFCGARPTTIDTKDGITESEAKAWNTRFGIYSSDYHGPYLTDHPPDRTGYAYTREVTWQSGANAYNDFLDKREAYRPYETDSLPYPKAKDLHPITSDQHRLYGNHRRVVLMPVMHCKDWLPNGHNIPIYDWACALMLSPIYDSKVDVKVEFRGLLGAATCAGFGSPGGGGIQVPALVQ